MDKHNPGRKVKRTHRPRTEPERSTSQDLVTKTLAQDPHALAPRLQRLMQAMAAVPEPPSARLDCAECDGVLEFYVDAEARGKNVRKHWPRIWKHLKSCKRCRLSYQLLIGSAPEDPLPEFNRPVVSALSLALLQPPAGDARWTKHVRPRVGGGPLNFGLAIQAAHLRQRLDVSRPSVPVRGAPAARPKALVLSDTIPLGDRDVMVKVWVQRQPDPEFVEIEILLACSSPLPDPLQLKLTWNEQVHTDLVHGNRYTFDKLPASALEGANDLQVEFIASDHPEHIAEEHSGGDPG